MATNDLLSREVSHPGSTRRDLEYTVDGALMRGHVVEPASTPEGATAVLVLPDAYGAGEDMLAVADRLTALGHPVLVADVWGERAEPTSPEEFGPMIGGLAGDRETWLARVRAARAQLDEQPETAGRPVCLLGFCFGGSGALEYLRTGGDADGVVSVHGGLDLLADDWSAHGSASVLLCTGEEDPMATAAQREALTGSLEDAGLDWQLHVYSDTVHAFTSPRAAAHPHPGVTAYSARATERSWAALTQLLAELDA
ncbi:dienelactone hydrolase family protein [Nocardioides sp. GY 10127]|uniref:dienelactone hydrolase family protein n=1 Tax=Nocardioides sp. GY 10127 TaxID=2569762 RepID=UPI0010A9315C|nr:dienelactone hydrolase family protein [Nocardioides sp. GY 10127]TIC79303.1 dienelactone hydrolase family protein [Nocardioides sp. GY 10127]